MSSDNYNTTAGQIAAVGREAHVHDNTFQQIWNQAGIDLPKLTEELGRLLSVMTREATEGTRTPEQDEAIGAVTAAAKAAAQGDGPTVLRHLKAAGKWALEVAEKIGVAVAAEAIKKTM